MKTEMCLEGLQRCIQRNFTDRVLVSYALLDSARPFGSKVVCEVDLCRREDELACDNTVEFAVQIVAEHDSKCFIKCRDEKTVDTIVVKAEDREYIMDLSDSSQQQVPDTGGESELDKKAYDSLKENLSCHLRNSNGTLEISTIDNKSLKESVCNFFREYSEDGKSFQFFILEDMITLTPSVNVGTASYASLESILLNLNSDSVEEKILKSVNLFLEDKNQDSYALEFMNAVGMPLSCQETGSSLHIRHPNVVPMIGMLRNSEYMFLIFPKAPYTLEDILHFSPGALKNDCLVRFVAYQILSALAHIHNKGIAHGNLNPSNVLLTDTYWCCLGGCGEHFIQNAGDNLEKLNSSSAFPDKRNICTETCPCQTLFADLKLSSSVNWESDFKRWWEGKLSNFEYLLTLNRLAGRRWGDRTFYTVMPWVIDFTVKPDVMSEVGWRDLKKSKWHLAKGDEQLDFTYSSSEIPHHVSDECLSELAVCSYKARRLPLSVLRRTVRSVYEPNEYPANMQRLYQWTPDECIPEFYNDPRVFYSIHAGMSDLAVPSWAANPEEFISLHRAALESDRVSLNLHHWIDLTFGYKLSGEAAIAAKNVTLSTSAPTLPRSMGRRQLFTRPHPMRKCVSKRVQDSWKSSTDFKCQILEYTNESMSRTIFCSVLDPENVSCDRNLHSKSDILSMSASLEEMEKLSLFTESSRHLSPCYRPVLATSLNNIANLQNLLESKSQKRVAKVKASTFSESSCGGLNKFLDCLETFEDGRDRNFQDFLLWENKFSGLNSPSETLAADIFAVGCIIAELHLHRPLFDPVSLAAYIKDGILPELIKRLPPFLCRLVELTLHRDWRRRPSAKALMESPYFPSTVRSAYLFLAPLYLMGSKSSCLQYAAKLAREGALVSMGTLAAEMCATSCLPLILAPESDFDVEAAVQLLKDFLRSLKPQAAKSLLLPSIQKILQGAESSHLKVALIQISFIRDLWKSLGLQAYLEKIHPLVISNLCISSKKNTAAAASVLLVGSCEELGVPITINQTIVPLMQCFGRGIGVDGLETLVRIGGHLGEKVIIRQMMPLLRSIILSGIDFANVDKSEPFQSWHTLALIDALTVLHGLVRILPSSVVLTELVQEQNNVHVKLLMHAGLNKNLVQHTVKALLAICQHIGPDHTAVHVLPQLKPLLDELAFSQEVNSLLGDTSNHDNSSRTPGLQISGNSEMDEETHADSRIDVVFFLYPSLASLLGIERLRQCFTTWLLLEQVLFRRYKWKWKCMAEVPQNGSDNIYGESVGKRPAADFNPANLLLNGVGWSIPQSQASKISKSMITSRQQLDNRGNASSEAPLCYGEYEPWCWLPSMADSWEGPEFLGRLGSIKDEHPWRLKASVLHSVRAHPGALRAVAVEEDECTVFSAGTGQRMRGIVCKWRLSTLNCMIGYLGHEEVVNDICLLPGYGRVASCDGTVHVWNSQTGKRISIFSEPSETTPSMGSSIPSVSREGNEVVSGVNSTTLSGGILSAGFHGSLYTCMHCMEAEEKLVAGTGNGYLRFIDINAGRQLHLWRCEPLESSFSSLISAICCSGHRDKLESKKGLSSSTWIAAGFSSGHCRLLDLKSGTIIAHWRAHDGFVTKLAALDEHLLISSSLDRTLRLWDLRRSRPTQLQVFRGHSDEVSSFSIWGHDMLSASGSKIGLSSLSRPYDQEQQQRIFPQKLYSSDRGLKNMSAISTINVLPFSRLFLVGTEDGYLKVCC